MALGAPRCGLEATPSSSGANHLIKGEEREMSKHKGMYHEKKKKSRENKIPVIPEKG